MELDTFLYFICAFIDVYATEIDKNRPLEVVELYRTLRKVHYNMVYMLAVYDKQKDKTKAEYEDYYSFFFENIVKDNIDSKTLFEKYIGKKLK